MINVDQHLQSCQREGSCCVDYTNAWEVPATATGLRPLANERLVCVLPPTESPNNH